MGIKDLWTILRPYGERKPLFELQNKTVAVDLSCWVCEAQNIAEYTVQPRVNLVYVLEGDAPTLKHDTIAARNALQFKGKKPRAEGTKKCTDRSRFNRTLGLCEEMLKYMGVTCVKAKGEAEAMCAYLNANNLVDGCITQDSDCFAYGAKVVYRNFSISQQGLYSANGGAIDEYSISNLESSTGIGRYKIIALALLCGSDYSPGVFGVGKDSVLKLFEGIPEADILERLRSWKINVEYYEDLEKKLTQNACNSCGHQGKLASHNKNGCRECDTSKGCTRLEGTSKDEIAYAKQEITLRKKALEGDFPNEELIEEYLNNEQYVRNMSIDWKQPNIIKFIKFAKKYLQWEEIYSFEKFFPVLTRWQLKFAGRNNDDKDIIAPAYIKKIRNPKGMPSYEIIWSDIENIHTLAIPSEQIEESSNKELLSTIEPQELVQEAYPKLVEDYNASKAKPKNSKRKPKASKPTKKQKTVSSVGNDLKSLSINIHDTDGQTQTSSYNQNGDGDVDTNLDLSKFGDESDLDVSDVVDSILNYDRPSYIKQELEKIRPEDLESSFFTKVSNRPDLFERTFSKIDFSSSEDSD